MTHCAVQVDAIPDAVTLHAASVHQREGIFVHQLQLFRPGRGLAAQDDTVARYVAVAGGAVKGDRLGRIGRNRSGRTQGIEIVFHFGLVEDAQLVGAHIAEGLSVLHYIPGCTRGIFLPAHVNHGALRQQRHNLRVGIRECAQRNVFSACDRVACALVRLAGRAGGRAGLGLKLRQVIGCLGLIDIPQGCVWHIACLLVSHHRYQTPAFLPDPGLTGYMHQGVDLQHFHDLLILHAYAGSQRCLADGQRRTDIGRGCGGDRGCFGRIGGLGGGYIACGGYCGGRSGGIWHRAGQGDLVLRAFLRAVQPGVFGHHKALLAIGHDAVPHVLANRLLGVDPKACACGQGGKLFGGSVGFFAHVDALGIRDLGPAVDDLAVFERVRAGLGLRGWRRRPAEVGGCLVELPQPGEVGADEGLSPGDFYQIPFLVFLVGHHALHMQDVFLADLAEDVVLGCGVRTAAIIDIVVGRYGITVHRSDIIGDGGGHRCGGGRRSGRGRLCIHEDDRVLA